MTKNDWFSFKYVRDGGVERTYIDGKLVRNGRWTRLWHRVWSKLARRRKRYMHAVLADAPKVVWTGSKVEDRP